METTEKLKVIKRSFRLFMNGVTAASMRNKGLEYKINWGVSQIDLRNMASQYTDDKPLAIALWAEHNIRECKLLATMIMPSDEMSEDEATEWADTCQTIEIMESAVFNLFQKLDFAQSLACHMLASPDTLVRTGSYNLVCRLMKRNAELSDSLLKLIFEQASSDLKTSDRGLSHAIVNCLTYISTDNKTYAETADQILDEFGY